MRMRLRSSAGARFSHSGLGTTPNMAPPSRLEAAIPQRRQDEIAESHRIGWIALRRSRAPSSSSPDHLLELDQHAMGARRDARRRRAIRAHRAAASRRSGASLVALRRASAARMSSTAKRDVVEARASLRQVLRDRRIVWCRLQQLERGLPCRDEMRPHALRRDVFRRVDSSAPARRDRTRARPRRPTRRCRCGRHVASTDSARAPAMSPTVLATMASAAE